MWKRLGKIVARVLFGLVVTAAVLLLALEAWLAPYTFDEASPRVAGEQVHDEVIFGEVEIPEGIPPVELAGHHGSYDNGIVTWTSDIRLERHGLGTNGRLHLASSLPAQAVLVRSDPHHVEAVRGPNGRIVAVEVTRASSSHTRMWLRWRLPFDPPGQLQPPLIAGRVIQRVSFDGLRYLARQESAGQGGITALYPGYRAQHELTQAQVDWCDEELGDPEGSTGVPIYLRPDEAYFAAGGLNGELVSDRAHRRERLLLLVGGFAGLLAIFAVAYWLLGARAKHEEADAFLSQLG